MYSGLSKRLRVAGEMGKVTEDISNFRFPNACKIELRMFREAGTFIRVDGEIRQLILTTSFVVVFFLPTITEMVSVNPSFNFYSVAGSFFLLVW